MMNLKSKFKRLLSAILSFAVIGTALPSTLAVAEEVEKYPYSVFGRNGITVSASSNLCINGNIHTNKEADISYSNGNINGITASFTGAKAAGNFRTTRLSPFSNCSSQ